jgi:Flp pilus assembly protein TadG
MTLRTRPAQALVEFALVISVFMLLLLGTFDLARAYLSYTVVTNVVFEANRYAIAHQDQAPAVWIADTRLVSRYPTFGIDPAQLVLTPSPSALVPPYVTVTVVGVYAFHPVTPFVGALFGNPINMRVQTSALAG